MHSLEARGTLKTDPPGFSRCEEAKILYEEDTLLVDGLCFDTLQFARKYLRERIFKVFRQGSGADDGPVVKLHLVRIVRGSNLPPSLQFDNRIDERAMLRRFGDTACLLQSNDISGSLLDDTEAIELQLTNDRRLP